MFRIYLDLFVKMEPMFHVTERNLSDIKNMPEVVATQEAAESDPQLLAYKQGKGKEFRLGKIDLSTIRRLRKKREKYYMEKERNVSADMSEDDDVDEQDDNDLDDDPTDESEPTNIGEHNEEAESEIKSENKPKKKKSKREKRLERENQELKDSQRRLEQQVRDLANKVSSEEDKETADEVVNKTVIDDARSNMTKDMVQVVPKFTKTVTIGYRNNLSLVAGKPMWVSKDEFQALKDSGDIRGF